MKLNEILAISGKIILKTGLHIGTGSSEIHIGGLDNPVIRHPHTGLPYIPGSSIKGKMRSLLELKSGYMEKTKGKVLSSAVIQSDPNTGDQRLAVNIIKIFGEGASQQTENFGPTRASFWDAYLDEKYYKERIIERNLILTETKFENVINRFNGTAEHPRQIERVPEGAEFNFKITLKIFKTNSNTNLSDNKDDLIQTILIGLKLIELDGLGGSTSRGYGKVKFKIDEEDLNKKFEALKYEDLFR